MTTPPLYVVKVDRPTSWGSSLYVNCATNLEMTFTTTKPSPGLTYEKALWVVQNSGISNLTIVPYHEEEMQEFKMYMSPNLLSKLQEMANEENISTADIVRRALDLYEIVKQAGGQVRINESLTITL